MTVFSLLFCISISSCKDPRKLRIMTSPILSSTRDFGTVPEYVFTNRSNKQVNNMYGGSYKNVLYKYLDEPENNSADIFMKTSNFTVIYDAYPKARIHLLIIPNRAYWACDGIEHMKPSSLTFVKDLHALAQHIAESPSLAEVLKIPILRDTKVGVSIINIG